MFGCGNMLGNPFFEGFYHNVTMFSSKDFSGDSLAVLVVRLVGLAP